MFVKGAAIHATISLLSGLFMLNSEIAPAREPAFHPIGEGNGI